MAPTNNNIWRSLFISLLVVVVLFQVSIYYNTHKVNSAFLDASSSSSSLIKNNNMNIYKAAKGPSSAFISFGSPSRPVVSSSSPVSISKFETWIETVSLSPRIFIIHNLATKQQCEHLINLGKEKGMERAKILPYGQKELVESSTRTNTGAWLNFKQDHVVESIEKKIADITRTVPEQGENMQILHYLPGQQFQIHHDFFDPETDPPENFEPGGNRMCTVVLYLHDPEEGGETYFSNIDLPVLPKVGDAVLFYDMKSDGSVDRDTMHAGKPPIRGEKWVMSKWIHERIYQINVIPDENNNNNNNAENVIENNNSDDSNSSISEDKQNNEKQTDELVV